MKKIFALLLSLIMVLSLAGCGDLPDSSSQSNLIPNDSSSRLDDNLHFHEDEKEAGDVIDPDGRYFSKEEVALYIHTYGCLPHNFITKDEARDLGWEGGNVEEYAPGYAIGGDRFGNREGQLPKGHTYYECDIDTDGYHSRGSRRIVFSDDGLIYYTHDHYETFELLYGEE